MEWLGIVAQVASIIASSGVIAYLAKRWKDKKAERDGDLCLLRKGMLDTYKKYKDTKVVPQYEMQNFALMYDAYKARGGNSFIDEVHDHVITWETEV